jgi:hypothetical protein
MPISVDSKRARDINVQYNSKRPRPFASRLQRWGRSL